MFLLSFQNETLTPNEANGILINEFSLVLQNVGHHSIGKYMCMAANDAGKGSSQQVFLDVKCKLPKIQSIGFKMHTYSKHVCHRSNYKLVRGFYLSLQFDS